MDCESPRVAVSLYKNDDQKHVLKFLAREDVDRIVDLKKVYGEENVFLLPCMKCKACRVNYSHEWGIRCTLEALMHKHNYFITLTYRNPFDKYACKEDFNKFIDRIYHSFDKNVKYFACLESGDLTHRKHFHCVLFTDIDFELFEPVLIGQFYHYHSKLLYDLWTFGLHDITPFECDCAGYVAKYTQKDGQIFMSRNIGRSYFETHKEEIIKDGLRVYGNFGKDVSSVFAPKCFVRWLKEDNLLIGEELNDKKKRLQKNKIAASSTALSYRSEYDYLLNANRSTKKVLEKMKDDRNEFD